MTVSLFLAKLKQQEASLFLSIRQTWCDCNSANQSRAAEVKPCYYSHVSSVIWSKWVFRFLHHRGQEMDKSCPVCCLYIWPPVHCSSFTQTLILLHTSVRLHQYGEDEAALACCCCFSLFPVSFLSSSFFSFSFFKSSAAAQQSRWFSFSSAAHQLKSQLMTSLGSLCPATIKLGLTNVHQLQLNRSGGSATRFAITL